MNEGSRNHNNSFIDLLEDDLPGVFNQRPFPANFDNEWYLGPDLVKGINLEVLMCEYEQGFSGRGFDVSDYFDLGVFGGAPVSPKNTSRTTTTPAIDTLAFYLPFHRYYPVGWGIYLILDGIAQLAAELKNRTSNLSNHEAYDFAREFLTYHEEYHHIVELFGSRLEFINRESIYEDCIIPFYRKSVNTDQCFEEALANAYAYRKLKSSPRSRAGLKNPLLNALEDIISKSPVGYKEAISCLETADFNDKKKSLQRSIDFLVTSRSRDRHEWYELTKLMPDKRIFDVPVIIATHQSSPLITALEIDKRYYRYRDLQKGLINVANCQPIGIEGGHEKWEAPNGHRFTVPRHPKEFSNDTLRRIIKQAGLNMSISKFIRASHE